MIRLGLYVIIDPYNLGNNNFNEICKKIAESNVDTIQLRNKYKKTDCRHRRDI